MRRARSAAVAAVMAVAAMATAGCSGGDDAGEGPSAGTPAPPVGAHAAPLVRELNEIQNTAASRAWTTYGDLAAQRALGGGNFPRELATMFGYGWPTTLERDAEARSTLGLDGSKADQVVEVGESHGSGRFDGGIDTQAVVAKARQQLGATKDGTAGPLALWRIAPDDVDHGTRAVVELSRGTADFDVLAVDGDTLVRAASRAKARALSANGTGRTLAGEQGFRAVAECLGRPLVATLTDTIRAAGAVPPSPADFVTGAGVLGSSPTRLTQVACRTTPSKDAAEKIADTLRHELAHGRTRLSQLPWRELISDTKVTVGAGPGHVVKVTGTSGKSTQVVLEMLRSGDLSDLLNTSD